MLASYMAESNCQHNISIVYFAYLQDKLRYALIGDDEDENLFYLNPDRGVLTLRRPLSTSSSSQFDFKVSARDQRANERTAEATVSITVSRDQQPPRFIGAPYKADVSENVAVNSTVTRVIAQDPDLQVIVTVASLTDTLCLEIKSNHLTWPCLS